VTDWFRVTVEDLQTGDKQVVEVAEGDYVINAFDPLCTCPEATFTFHPDRAACRARAFPLDPHPVLEIENIRALRTIVADLYPCEGFIPASTPEDGHVYECCGKVGRISRHETWCPIHRAD
jgi:hypothetical protein